MNNIFIGIDPGKSGFFCIYNPQLDKHTFLTMPERKVETGKKLKSGKMETKNEFYMEGLRDIVFNIKKQFPNHKFYTTIEEVGGRQGWSAQNNFNFGHTAGLQALVPIMLGSNIQFVRPIKWQTYMYKGFKKIMIPSSTGKTLIHDTKATSEIVAKSLRPDISFTRTERAKTIDDNKTDAFLICMYGYKRFLENN